VIGITAAIAIGGAGDDGRGQWHRANGGLDYAKARWWLPFPWCWLTREPRRPSILWVYAAHSLSSKELEKQRSR